MTKVRRLGGRAGFTRRDVLQNALLGLAAMMAPGAIGCSEDSDTPGGSGGTGGSGGGGGAGGGPNLRSNFGAIGPLSTTPDANGLRLPEGFTARVIARGGEIAVPGKDYVWHAMPDGGATFPLAGGGWVLVSNCELPIAGGVGALVFEADGTITDAYRILDGTNVNCAGGRTPWGTWLSCEEVPTGRVFDCDPMGVDAAVELPALGIFKHEAAIFDTDGGAVYLSEDQPDGRFYRFTPASTTGERWDLASGTLEVAEVGTDGAVTWHALPDPQATQGTDTRDQVPASTAFDGGEGLWYHAGKVYLTTKGDNRVWQYEVSTSTMTVLYDAATAANPILTGVDNIIGTVDGDLLVAEDGGDMQIVAILPDGTLKPIVQVLDQPTSEVTGLAFDPSGSRLYFNSQHGPNGATSYEISGPFHLPAE